MATGTEIGTAIVTETGIEVETATAAEIAIGIAIETEIGTETVTATVIETVTAIVTVTGTRTGTATGIEIGSTKILGCMILGTMATIGTVMMLTNADTGRAFYTGANDARRGESYDPERSHFYRHGAGGFLSVFGSRGSYSQAYRDGFLRGYQEGYQNWQRFFIGGSFHP